WTHWATEPFGFGLKYFLGSDFNDFLSYPLFHGRPTYLVGLLHALIAAIGVVLFLRAGYQLWEDPRGFRASWFSKDSSTAFVQNAALWGFGILLTVPGLAFQRHYVIIAFPLQFVWLARLALAPTTTRLGALRSGRALLGTLFVCELLLSAQFLAYI